MRRAAILLLLLLVASVSACIDGSREALDARAKKLAAGDRIQSVYAGDYKFEGRYSHTLVEGPLSVLPLVEQRLKSKLDGVDIQFVIWRPETTVPVPVIIQASPYFRDTKNSAGLGTFIIDNFVPHGYAYVQLAIRSTGDSGGCDDFRGPKMTADMSQAIDWLAAQPWSNGNVTLIGISYVGTTPWYAAGSGNPHIKTIVPISGSTDAWMVYNRNGSAEARSPGIIAGYGQSAANNPNRSTEKKIENFTCTDAAVYKAWVAGYTAGYTGQKEPFREFWDERNVKPKVEKNYKGSIFVIHGFEDWNVDPAIVFPWSRTLNITYGLHVKTLIGQWAHTYPDMAARLPDGTTNWTNPMVRADYAEMLLRWFDHWLKGLPTDLGPSVQVQDNQKRWRDDAFYPPIDADWTTLHLANGGQLTTAAGAAGNQLLLPTNVDPGQMFRQSGIGPAKYFSDFTWGPFDEEVKLSGLPRVHVTVTPHGPGGYIGAYLFARAQGSTEMTRVGWTSMNLRFADGGDVPKEVVPNQPLLAKMEIQPLEAALPPNHQLILRVWVNGHYDRQPSLPPSAVTLNWGGSHKSILELPIIERSPETYFEPPRPK